MKSRSYDLLQEPGGVGVDKLLSYPNCIRVVPTKSTRDSDDVSIGHRIKLIQENIKRKDKQSLQDILLYFGFSTLQ